MAKDLSQALHELTEQAQGQTSRKDEKLPAAKPVTGIPARSGVGRPGGSGSGSVAGPLNESSAAARTHWPERSIVSSDGILVLRVAPIKSVKFFDANASELIVNYANPA